jgi:hypothetical protein
MAARQPAAEESGRDPLVIAEQGHFFAAVTEVEHAPAAPNAEPRARSVTNMPLTTA